MMSTRSRAFSRSLRLLGVVGLIWTPTTSLLAQAPRQGNAARLSAPADTLLEAIWKKIGNNKKRVGKLATLMDEQVQAALSNQQAGWTSGLGTGEQRPFSEHPDFGQDWLSGVPQN